MVFIFGIFTKKHEPVSDEGLEIISDEDLQNGNVRIGDLVKVTGGCPRFPGDECYLVGEYKSVVFEYYGELYYRIVV